MGDKHNRDAADLRRRAEDALHNRRLDLDQPAGQDVRELIYELQLHQAELELQNEELRRANLALEAADRHYQELFDLAPLGYFTLDAEGAIREANLAGAALLGVERKRLAGQALSRYVAPGAQDTFYHYWRGLCRPGAGGGRACELHMVRADETRFHARLEALGPGHETEPGCRLALRDVSQEAEALAALQAAYDEMETRVQARTEELLGANQRLQAEAEQRRRAEAERERLLLHVQEDRRDIQDLAEALAAERDVLRAIMDSTDTHLAYLDLDFKFVRVNAVYQAGSGYTVEELIGRDHFELFPNAENQAIFAEVRESGRPAAFRARPFVYENQPERGMTYWDWTLTPVRDAQDQMRGLVLSLHDVTDRERARREREARLASLDAKIALSRELLAESTAEGVLHRVLVTACGLTGARLCAAGRYTPEGGFEIYAEAQAEDAPGGAPGALLDAAQAAARRETLDEAGSLRLATAELAGGLLAVRLDGPGGQAGGLILAADRRAGDFTAEDEALLAQLAALAELGLRQVEARQEAERRAAELEAVFAAMTNAVVVYDAAGRPLRANPAAWATCGVDPAGLVRADLAEKVRLRYADGRPVPAAELPTTRALGGATVRGERLMLTAADGCEEVALVSAAPLRAEAGIRGAVLVWQDVTALESVLEDNRRQREFLEQLMGAAPIGIAVVRGPEHRFEYANPAYRAIPGVAGDDLLGRTATEVAPGISMDGLGMLDECYRGGRPLSLREYPARLVPGGEPSYWNLEHVPLRGENGAVDGVLILAQEVSEQVRARRRVEELAARDEAILRSMSDGMLIFDMQGNILDANPAALRLYGWADEAEARRPIAEHAPGFELHDPKGNALPPEESPARRVLRGESFTGLEVRVRRTGAGPSWFASYNGGPVRDKEGRVILGLLTIRDISERKEAEAERERLLRQLEAERALLQAIIHNAPEGIVVADAGGRLVLANPVAERIYAQPAPLGEPLESHTALGLCHPDGTPYDPRELPLTRAALDGETSRELEVGILRPDGERGALLVNTAPICDEAGAITGAVAVFQDITERKHMEERLAYHALLLDHVHDAIVATDTELRVTAWNRAAEELYGWKAEEVLGRPAREVIPSDFEDEERAAALEELADRGVFRAELRQYTRNGRVIYAEGRSVPVRDGVGRIVGYIGANRDITLRKQAEQALRGYAGRLQAMRELDQAILAASTAEEIARVTLALLRRLIPYHVANVALFDPAAGQARVLAARPEAAPGLEPGAQAPLVPGYPPEALRRGEAHVVEEIDPQAPTSPAWEALWEQGARSFVTVPLRAGGELIGALGLARAETGGLAPEEMEIAREVADELAVGLQQARLLEQVRAYAGELEGLVARRTEALRASEARFRAVFEQTALGIALTDAEGRLLASNPALQDMLGYTAEELAGMTFRDYTHPDDLPADQARFEEMLSGREDHYRMEKRYLHKSGEPLWGSLTASAVREAEGDFRFAVRLIQDITRQKQIQEALVHSEKLAVAGRLAASLAHEINNPLQSVIGCLALAEETLEREEADASRYLRVAGEELQRTARIVGQLRDLHRPREGGERRPADVNELVERLVTLNRARCARRQVELAWAPAGALPSPVVDPDDILQVFLNLLLNALDAMPGGGRLEIRAAATRRPGGVSIAFRDTGHGIPEDILEHIFDPFFSTKSEGLGLGLFTSQSIVRDHGGYIEVDSREGEGTTFTVWLPVGE
jgi:PAS domain S-box-containing protein